MKLTLESIRERYPNPVKAWTKRNDLKERGYCVGGALCRTALRDKGGFPGWIRLTYALQKANPALPHDEAGKYAERIFTANDSGDFETALAKLGEALSYGGVE